MIVPIEASKEMQAWRRFVTEVLSHGCGCCCVWFVEQLGDGYQ